MRETPAGDGPYRVRQVPNLGIPKLQVGSRPARVLMICRAEASYALRRRLEALGAEVSTLDAAPEACAAARAQAPDLILLETTVPDTVGLGVLRTLRKDPRTYAIPVVVLSGVDDAVNRARSLDEGASDCLAKPFSLAELTARIRSTLRTKIREDLLRRRIMFLEELAACDPLTSLLNRRAFIDRLHLEMESAARNGQPLSCLILDIDKFKSVNDQHGHQVGDDALRQIAKVMVEGGREGDVVCRFGGEEFVWLLPGVDQAALLEHAEWLRRTIEEVEIPTAEGSFRISVSIGASSYQLRNHGRVSAHLLLQQADAALLEAKRQGRNRVIFREPIPLEREEAGATVPEATLDDPVMLLPEMAPRHIDGARQASWASDLADTLDTRGGDLRIQEELRKLLRSSVTVLTAALEARDPETMKHCRRVASTAAAIAMEMGLPTDEVERIELASLLHDLGKLAVPETILQKPGPLTAEEWGIIRKHPERGAAILQDAESFSGLVDLVLYHQESFDGTGYPDGLAGEKIPLGARIIRVSDTFDALTSDRPYRPRKTLEEAKVELRRMAGTTLDPAVVEALLRLLETMSPLEVELMLRREGNLAHPVLSEPREVIAP